MQLRRSGCLLHRGRRICPSFPRCLRLLLIGFTSGHMLTVTTASVRGTHNLRVASYTPADRWAELTMAVAVERCREKTVQAGRSAKRKRADDVGGSAPVPALRPEGRRPFELHRRRPCRVPAVPQTSAGRRPRPTERPRPALSVGVRTDDRRPSGAPLRRAASDGQDFGVGAVRDGADGGRGPARGTRLPPAVRHRGRGASRSLAQVATNVRSGTRKSWQLYSALTSGNEISIDIPFTDQDVKL